LKATLAAHAASATSIGFANLIFSIV